MAIASLGGFWDSLDQPLLVGSNLQRDKGMRSQAEAISEVQSSSSFVMVRLVGTRGLTDLRENRDSLEREARR